MSPSNEQGSDRLSKRRAEYLEKLKHPRWQKVRLKVFERDDWVCQLCFGGDVTLHVHHRYYEEGKEPWNYPLDALVTLCEDCHAGETENRSREERALLRAIREHFLAADINSLACGFMNMKLTHLAEVVATAIEWALVTPKIQRELVDRYLDELVVKVKKE